jgi:MFS family permease
MAGNFPQGFEEATFRKVAWRLIPFLFLCYIVAFLDRVNVGFAKLQMAGDLQYSDAVYGFGAGIFFIGYFIFEVPSNVILEKVGARIWIARIMVTWGLISSAFMFAGDIHWGGVAAAFGHTDAEFTFYVLRFLLGVAEAGFFPGIILYLTYWFPGGRRAKMVALFMSAIGVANVLGAPVSGAIMQYMDGANGWRGWQWLFLLEGIPSVVIGLLVLAILPDGPNSSKWLAPGERELIATRIREDVAGKSAHTDRHSLGDAFKDGRVWALSVVYFCGAVAFYAVNFWMPTIIQEFGIDKRELFKVGLLTMIPWATTIVAMIFWGAHSDKTGERRWHCASGFLVTCAGLVILAIWPHAAIIAMVALTMVTVGWGMFVVTFWSLPTAFLAGTAAAAGIALINSVGNLGGYFGPDLIGRIRTATGGASEAAFWTLSGIALLGAVIVLSVRRPATKAAIQPPA